MSAADHPRACGANDHPTCGKVSENGSSPRVRGKLVRVLGRVALGRIIPARAGQTREPYRAFGRRPDHPRACGANVVGDLMHVPVYGSSPRVRGKPDRVVRVPDVGRIIPARAGQTMRHRPPNHEHADHPRACGANCFSRTGASAGSGSSPRVRGKPGDRHLPAVRRRIIPARAGQTLPASRSRASPTDHPRACGANAGSFLVSGFGHGSSPRVRGKRKRIGKHIGVGRIIPARAGQTGSVRPLPSRRSDHPRACGANDFVMSAGVGEVGSSPRVRGKRSTRSSRSA